MNSEISTFDYNDNEISLFTEVNITLSPYDKFHIGHIIKNIISIDNFILNINKLKNSIDNIFHSNPQKDILYEFLFLFLSEDIINNKDFINGYKKLYVYINNDPIISIDLNIYNQQNELIYS